MTESEKVVKTIEGAIYGTSLTISETVGILELIKSDFIETAKESAIEKAEKEIVAKDHPGFTVEPQESDGVPD